MIAYTGVMTSLLRAFAGMPKLDATDPSKPRLFNLRIYQSHNDRAAAKKVEMFETEELAIFRRCGLTPVFFSSSFAGTALPNIHYMLVFPDEAARAAAWRKFGADEGWKKLAAKPEYADREIVSKILNVVLAPRPYSGL